MHINPLLEVAMKTKTLLSLFIVIISVSPLWSQISKIPGWTIQNVQSYDPNYVAPTPYIPFDSGTIIYIDQAHNNFHTYDQRFKPFSDLIRNDGFQVAPFTQTFTPASLADVKILVISNPVNDVNHPEPNWVSPILSAFTTDEINALTEWVADGGSLLLIADHYPFPGAVADLTTEFGFTLDNGYNFDPEYYNILKDRFFQLPIIQQVMAGTADPSDPVVNNQIIMQAGGMFIALGAEVNTISFWNNNDPASEPGFQAGDGTILHHELMQNRAGAYAGDTVPFITTFTGHSFDATEVSGTTLHPLLWFGEGPYTVLTEAQDAYFGPDANTSNQNTLVSLLTTGDLPDFVVPVVDASEKLQAAIVEYGSGKVAFFGEAGMFTAQIAADGATKMGINNTQAEHNWKFILNLMRYLDGYDPTTVSTPSWSSENPHAISLFQNYPNPFNPSTRIGFSLPNESWVTIEVFDVSGRRISTLVDKFYTSGTHFTTFDASNLTSGVYIYRLTTPEYSYNQKMVLTK